MIVAAAIKLGGLICHMPAPMRHHNILREILVNFDKRSYYGYANEVQGFLTDTGEFLNRRDAYEHALECGQGVPRRTAMLADNSTLYNGTEAFSEDFW